jgi:hypothetical protein
VNLTFALSSLVGIFPFLPSCECISKAHADIFDALEDAFACSEDAICSPHHHGFGSLGETAADLGGTLSKSINYCSAVPFGNSSSDPFSDQKRTSGDASYDMTDPLASSLENLSGPTANCNQDR